MQARCEPSGTVVRANAAPLGHALAQQRVHVVVSVHETVKDAADRHNTLERFGGRARRSDASRNAASRNVLELFKHLCNVCFDELQLRRQHVSNGGGCSHSTKRTHSVRFRRIPSDSVGRGYF